MSLRAGKMFPANKSAGEMTSKKRKRGVRNPELYERERKKVARRNGLEYVSETGKVIPAKTTGPDCGCSSKCMDIFIQEDRDCLLRTLYSGRPKNEQDTFLMGLIEIAKVLRRRPRNEENPRARTSNFHYFALCGNERVKVCKKAFLSLFALKKNSVARLTRLLLSKQPPVDRRGRHQNRGNTIPPDVIEKIDQHIRSFPTKAVRVGKKLHTYLDSGLSVKKMHKCFCSLYADSKITYEYYRKYFRENFDYRFENPNHSRNTLKAVHKTEKR